MTTKRYFALSLIALLLSGCTASKETLKPQLDYAVQDKYLKHLKPVFLPLSPEELSEPWGHEYVIGLAFAKKLDLFHAISSFKRAEILIPHSLFTRKAEIQYQILACYYLAKRFDDVIDTFEDSVLASTDKNFVAFHDLFVILFESYLKCDQKERAEWILQRMEKWYPQTFKKLEITEALCTGNLQKLETLASNPEPRKELALLEAKKESSLLLVNSFEDDLSLEDSFKHHSLKEYTDCQESLKEIVSHYETKKKHPFLAAALNAAIPGSGYLYLGQKQSAFTAFCLNSLCIASSVYFYKAGNIPGAIVMGSFEMGWYLGGIKGAKEHARLYNERLFENESHYRMRDHKLYPVLMLSHGF